VVHNSIDYNILYLGLATSKKFFNTLRAVCVTSVNTSPLKSHDMLSEEEGLKRLDIRGATKA